MVIIASVSITQFLDDDGEMKWGNKMGARDLDKYPKIKELLGIPQDEPIFIIRGKDKTAWLVLNDYRYRARWMGASTEFTDHIDDCINEFVEWREANPDVMKVPD